MPGSLDVLWPAATDAFKDVDYILHAGDLHTLEVVDALNSLAPTYVAIGNGDVGIVDDRLQETWLLDFDGVQVGMVHHFPSPVRKSAEVISKRAEKHFLTQPDVLIFGHTHFEGVYQVNDMLCINPGSPTLPRNQSIRMGTIGYLDIHDHQVTASIHQITEAGIEPHAEIEVHSIARR